MRRKKERKPDIAAGIADEVETNIVTAPRSEFASWVYAMLLSAQKGSKAEPSDRPRRPDFSTETGSMHVFMWYLLVSFADVATQHRSQEDLARLASIATDGLSSVGIEVSVNDVEARVKCALNRPGVSRPSIPLAKEIAVDLALCQIMAPYIADFAIRKMIWKIENVIAEDGMELP